MALTLRCPKTRRRWLNRGMRGTILWSIWNPTLTIRCVRNGFKSMVWITDRGFTKAYHPYPFHRERPNKIYSLEAWWVPSPFLVRRDLWSILDPGRGEITPRHLKIYANHSTIVDFSEAESTEPQLNISLLEGETGVVEYPLRVASFTSVHSLSLFFVSKIALRFLVSHI